ncbi:homeobox protein Hox-B3-like [Rhynchophorus ferrugineus]|uniref:homeobox protein Hox-B3-like n=1 Tax=Rhynchophorus ferrugineus TaxID=354439 RepID=UPI003FCEE62B
MLQNDNPVPPAYETYVNQQQIVNHKNQSILANHGNQNEQHYRISTTSTNSMVNIDKTRVQPSKRTRTSYKSFQLFELEEAFTQNPYISKYERIVLSQSLNLPEKNVRIWFQNRRMRYKKEMNWKTSKYNSQILPLGGGSDSIGQPNVSEDSASWQHEGASVNSSLNRPTIPMTYDQLLNVAPLIYISYDVSQWDSYEVNHYQPPLYQLVVCDHSLPQTPIPTFIHNSSYTPENQSEVIFTTGAESYY